MNSRREQNEAEGGEGEGKNKPANYFAFSFLQFFIISGIPLPKAVKNSIPGNQSLWLGTVL